MCECVLRKRETWRGEGGWTCVCVCVCVCVPFGVEILYKCGGRLIGERTTRPSRATVTELQFADDASVA